MHKIHGNATALSSYVKLLSIIGKKADLLLTDPPYFILNKRNRNINNSKRVRKFDIVSDVINRYETTAEYFDFMDSWMNLCITHMLKEDAMLIVWTNPLGKNTISTIATKYNYCLVGEYLWMKPSDNKKHNMSSTKNETLYVCRESALVFSKSMLPTLNHSDLHIPWCVSSPTEGTLEIHPFQKPHSVIEPLIRTWSKTNDWIFDPFAGSGAILKSAYKLGRNAAGMELSEKWSHLL
jgi:site-specific DNA-methyltransferase (adenine-specific)